METTANKKIIVRNNWHISYTTIIAITAESIISVHKNLIKYGIKPHAVCLVEIKKN